MNAHVRCEDDQNYVDVIGVLDAAEDKSTTSTGGRIRRLNITPGALVFFCGRCEPEPSMEEGS
jgi:hypothetical protein